METVLVLQPEMLFWIDSCLQNLCENKTFECLSCGSQVQWIVTVGGLSSIC